MYNCCCKHQARLLNTPYLTYSRTQAHGRLLLNLLCCVSSQVQLLVCARDGTVCGVDVPALLHLYKARLAMACGNFKAAKKEVSPSAGVTTVGFHW